MDLLDEVDENDQPTGRQVTRAEAEGAARLLHRCVAVYVFAPDGRLYVQTHKKSGLLDHSVGGHVDAGEDYLTAAKRETAEELGIQNVPFQEIGLHIRSSEHYSDRSLEHMFGLFVCQAPPDWRFVPNEEVDEVVLLSLDEIVARVNKTPLHFTSGFINVLKFYVQAKQLPYAVTSADASA